MMHSRDRPMKVEREMKSKGFLAGLLYGALVFGGTTAYAAGIVAELSTQPIYGSKGTPYVSIQLSIDAEKTAQSFWPWKESELTNQFNSCPIGTYQMEAWDVFLNDAFQYTEYLIYAV